jgi:hypothetical protein
MTRGEIKASIDADGGVKNQKAKAWDEAFSQYNAAHTQKKRRGCGSCYRDVYAWLGQ